VLSAAGRDARGVSARVMLARAGSGRANYAFDVKPARLVTGLITERGMAATSDALGARFDMAPLPQST
jgi:methylthioribose-1-phosphate isomerase